MAALLAADPSTPPEKAARKAEEARALFRLARAYAAERATDQSRPSTPLDIELGRRTELDFFNGLVIDRGRSLGIPTPANAAVMELARSIEHGTRAPGLENLRWLEDRLR